MTEIFEIIRSIGRRWVAIILATIIAGAIVAVRQLPPEPTFVTEVTVGIAEPGMNSNDRLDAIANLRTAAQARSTLDAVSTGVEIPRNELRKSTRISQVGVSSFVSFKYTSGVDDPDRAKEIVDAFVDASWTSSNAPVVANAQIQYDAAAAALTTIREELAAIDKRSQELNATTQGSSPEAYLTRLLSNIDGFESAIIRLDPADDAATIAATQVAIDTLRAKATEVAPLAAESRDLEARRSEVSIDLTNVSRNADAALTTLNNEKIPPTVEYQQLSVDQTSTAAAIQRILAAILATFVLGALLTLVFDATLGRNRIKRVAGRNSSPYITRPDIAPDGLVETEHPGIADVDAGSSATPGVR